MVLGNVLRKLKNGAIDVGNRLREREGEGCDRVLLSSASIDPRAKEVIPQRGLEDFCRFYNREYEKYDMVKKMRKSVRLMKREEFAYRRALILTLLKLSAPKGDARGEESILHLVQHEDVGEIEERLKQIK